MFTGSMIQVKHSCFWKSTSCKLRTWVVIKRHKLGLTMTLKLSRNIYLNIVTNNLYLKFIRCWFSEYIFPYTSPKCLPEKDFFYRRVFTDDFSVKDGFPVPNLNSTYDGSWYQASHQKHTIFRAWWKYKMCKISQKSCSIMCLYEECFLTQNLYEALIRHVLSEI